MEEQKNNNLMKTSGNVLVVCRVRPMNKKEIAQNCKNIIKVDK
jgi:magnesium-transporting ATPase (P-type)